MCSFFEASAKIISTATPHKLRTFTERDDLVGWVLSGRKRLITPAGEVQFAAGQVFALPRLSQWDMLNEPRPGGRYEARLISFAPTMIERFRDRFAQFTTTAPIQGCARSVADEEFDATFSHASEALQGGDFSNAVREHRVLEVLLLLAERGIVFSATRELAWADRVRRLVSHRPQANWALSEVAEKFNLSASTLQRRLADESASFSDCVRETRLETALALLQDSGLQVSEVAARCGYDSHSRFSAAFRERFGFKPSCLRPSAAGYIQRSASCAFAHSI